MLCEEGGHLTLVLRRGEGAGGVDQHTARSQQRRGVFKNFRTQLCAVGHQRIAVLGGRHGLLAEHPLAGAGRIHENTVKLPGQRRRQTGRVLVGDDGVCHAHTLQILAQNLGAGRNKFIGQQQSLPLQGRGQLAGLAARRGAQVGHPHTGAHIEQRCRGGGAGLLRIQHACMVPCVASRAEIRRSGKGRSAKAGRLCGKINMLCKPFRRAAQCIHRHTAGRLRRGIGIQLLKPCAQQCLLPRRKILWKFQNSPPA